MGADLDCPECERGSSDNWSGPGTGLKADLECGACAEWEDKSDAPLRSMKGIIAGVCLSVPLWVVIIGGIQILFRI